MNTESDHSAVRDYHAEWDDNWSQVVQEFNTPNGWEGRIVLDLHNANPWTRDRAIDVLLITDRVHGEERIPVRMEYGEPLPKKPHTESFGVWDATVQAASDNFAVDAIMDIWDLFCSERPARCEGDVSVMEEGAVTTTERRGNVEISSGDAPVPSSFGPSVKTSVLSDTMLGMSEFLARPIQIASFTIGESTTVNTTVDAWNLLFSEPALRAKLRNYGFIKGDLHVRIVQSGTPFHYGRLYYGWVPFDSYNDALQKLISVGASQSNLITFLSQVPGSQIVDVRRNVPIDLIIPYISPQPMIRLFNKQTAAQAAGSAFNDIIELGQIYIYTVNQVKSVSASPSTISLYVYAWLENVELGCATGTQSTVTTESDHDERKTGPVQRIASRVSAISKSLMSVPIISPFASASSMIADGVGSLAALFGWSVPTIETMPSRVKNEPYQNAAHVIGYDTGKRITLDPKQELTVDPRVVGVTEDEMSIAYVAGIESYLTTFTWPAGTAPLSGPLWESIVSPIVGVQDSGANYIQPTALLFSAIPFLYWRGDITFRFEIVCSNFHRGVLGFYYEPNVSAQVLIDANLSLNKQFFETIDIQQAQSVSFCVNWSFARHWAMVMTGRGMTVGSCGTSITSPMNYFEYANGYIGCTPITEIQSPDGSGVSVNVYVHSKNIQYNQFSDVQLPISRALTESDKGSADNSSIEVTCFEINPTGASMDHISELHFGEVPVSFRNLLRRFTTTYVAEVSNTGLLGIATYTGPIIPPTVPSFTTGTTYGPALLGYLQYAYLGMRGGQRKRIRYVTADSQGFMNAVKVGLQYPTTSVTTGFSFTAASYGPNQLLGGYVAFIPHTNAGIEFELPFYSNNLFHWACTSNPYNSTAALNNLVTQQYNAYFEVALATKSAFVEESAVGEDFSLLRWIAAPAYVV